MSFQTSTNLGCAELHAQSVSFELAHRFTLRWFTIKPYGGSLSIHDTITGLT
jgi:hypothetical protein